ncbi:uncharacterized protein LOC143289609 [Babylonia areolata]|uniref:uncharacterized protein LOC143289609 n=1 Tax=Babylonia areolata TaxID=304850 RepID=UPI003FD59EFE
MARHNLNHHHHLSSTTTLTTLTIHACLLLVAMLALHGHAQTHAYPEDAYQEERGGGVPSRVPALTLLLQRELAQRGLDADDVDSLVKALGDRPTTGVSVRNDKRAGWKRIPIQTRFAPFGTKLIPSRSRGDSSGPTLLRYGRSTA